MSHGSSVNWHEVTVSCPPVPRVVPELRVLLRPVLAQLGLPAGLAEAAELVTTELATNAVRHARGDFSVRLRPTPGGLRIEVADPSAERPEAVGRPGPLDEHGRGLPILATLTQRWGVTPTPGGKICWAELGQETAEVDQLASRARRSAVGEPGVTV
jgi:anti-sigma regulatory factor (Ser/Thr protein kinase)